MGILLLALQAAWGVFLQVVLNPVVLLVVILLGVLYVLAFVAKLAWAVTLWNEVTAFLGNAWAQLKADPLAAGAVAFVFSINVTFGLIALGVYFLLKALKVVIPLPKL